MGQAEAFCGQRLMTIIDSSSRQWQGGEAVLKVGRGMIPPTPFLGMIFIIIILFFGQR